MLALVRLTYIAYNNANKDTVFKLCINTVRTTVIYSFLTLVLQLRGSCLYTHMLSHIHASLDRLRVLRFACIAKDHFAVYSARWAKWVLHSKKNCAQKILVEYLCFSQMGSVVRKNLRCGFIKHSTYSFNLVILQPPTPEKYFFLKIFFFSFEKEKRIASLQSLLPDKVNGDKL